jgi:hypothetical protein
MKIIFSILTMYRIEMKNANALLITMHRVSSVRKTQQYTRRQVYPGVGVSVEDNKTKKIVPSHPRTTTVISKPTEKKLN